MFDMLAAIAKINASIGSARTLLDASKTLANAELKQMIAELAMKLADASLEMAELKHEVIQLRDENAALKAKKEVGKPTMKWGCYQFEGEEGLFCPKCWERDGKKHHTNRAMNGKLYKCTVCDTMFPTG